MHMECPISISKVSLLLLSLSSLSLKFVGLSSVHSRILEFSLLLILSSDLRGLEIYLVFLLGGFLCYGQCLVQTLVSVSRNLLNISSTLSLSLLITKFQVTFLNSALRVTQSTLFKSHLSSGDFSVVGCDLCFIVVIL